MLPSDQPRRDHPRKDHAKAFLSRDPDEFAASQNAAAVKLPDFRKTSVVDAEKAAGKRSATTSNQLGFFPKRESSAQKDTQRDQKLQSKLPKDASTSGKSTTTSATDSRQGQRVEVSDSDGEHNEDLPDLPKRKSPAMARKRSTPKQQSKKPSRKIPQSPSESEDEFLLLEREQSTIPGMDLMFSSQESFPSQSSSQATRKRQAVASDSPDVTNKRAKKTNKDKQKVGSPSESEAESLPPVSKKAKTADAASAASKATSTSSFISSKPALAQQGTYSASKSSATILKPDIKGKGKAVEPSLANSVAKRTTVQSQPSSKTKTSEGKGSQLAGKERSELPRSNASPPRKTQQGTGVKRKAYTDTSKPSPLQSGPSLARLIQRGASTDDSDSEDDCVQVAASVSKTAPRASGSNASKSNATIKASTTPAARPLSPRKVDSANDKASAVFTSSSSDAMSKQPRPRARPTASQPPAQDSKPIPISSAEIAKSLGVTPKAPKRQDGSARPKEQSVIISTSAEKTVRRARPTNKAQLAEAEKAKKKPLREGDVNRTNTMQGKAPQSIEITSSPMAPKKQIEIPKRKKSKVVLTDDEVDSDDLADLPDADTLFSNAAAGVEDIFSSQSTGTSARQDQLDDENNDSEGESSMAYTQAPNITTSLRCPFCDGALPDTPSEKLITMLVKLCSREDVKIRKVPSNDLALSLPMTVTIEACKRHREETETIPRGLEAGYPDKQSIDWKRLEARIEIISNQLAGIVFGTVKSSFSEVAKKEWQAKGARKMGNVMNEFSSFQQEMPGYYGFKGFELIMAALKKTLVDDGIITAAKTQPLDVGTYLRRVLVPEAAVRLIQGDRKNCSTEEAMAILEESRAYGAAVFGQDTSVADLETKREKRDREREQQEFRQQIQAILSSQETGSKALQRGRDAIVALRTLLAKQA